MKTLELSGVLQEGSDFLPQDVRAECERIIPEVDKVQPRDAADTYLFLKAHYRVKTKTSPFTLRKWALSIQQKFSVQDIGIFAAGMEWVHERAGHVFSWLSETLSLIYINSQRQRCNPSCYSCLFYAKNFKSSKLEL